MIYDLKSTKFQAIFVSNNTCAKFDCWPPKNVLYDLFKVCENKIILKTLLVERIQENYTQI